ncbi:hypothetical protein [Caulobacter phage Cr30]|uniref:hypothetical protein n=1 Tax=Caulobacter phage Cr30 TaxID=1357714 RepID=UPI0004A9B417|nr:hypothetical protein OZ74_gp223 [Caulobacter phage Cr30]AGS81120.1 hypothetical protein [Caulobacter phage Cr30]
MTVKDLIEKLQKFDENQVVRLRVTDEKYEGFDNVYDFTLEEMVNEIVICE